MNVSGTLSAAQSQYLSQLTQKSEVMKQERVMLNSQGKLFKIIQNHKIVEAN